MNYREIPVSMYFGTEYFGPYLAFASKQKRWKRYVGVLNFSDVKQRIMLPKNSLELLDLI